MVTHGARNFVFQAGSPSRAGLFVGGGVWVMNADGSGRWQVAPLVDANPFGPRTAPASRTWDRARRVCCTSRIWMGHTFGR